MPKLVLRRWLLSFSFLLFLLPQTITQAQSPLPPINSLSVELWPEYDRPEVLVIYRVELAPGTPLPAQVTFQLPGYVEAMHAVAVEQDGALLQVNPTAVELRPEGEVKQLSFPTSSLSVHFEYYDPVILTKQGQTRRLTYQFSPLTSIETATFEVQEPAQTQDFALIPESDRTFTGNDGFTYHAIEVTDLAPTETFTLTATYRRATDELSAPPLAETPSEHAADILPAPAAPVEITPPQNLTIGYILIGIGIVLLLWTGGYWWRSRQAKTKVVRRSQPSARPRRRKKGSTAGSAEIGRQVSKPVATSTPQPGSPVQFCYRCGTALRPEANFCHLCGAERRA